MCLQCSKKLETSSPQTAKVDGICESRRLLLYDRSTSCRYLIDTGSDVSIVPASKKDRNQGPSSFQLHAANGTVIKTYDSRYVTTDLGLRRQFRWQFVVADVSVPIIGADFLAFYGLLVDLKNKRLIDGKTNLKSNGGLSTAEIHSVTTVDSNHPFRDLLLEYREVTLPSTMRSAVKERDVKHHILTKGPPVAYKARRLAPDKLDAAKKEFQLMSDLGICRPSASAWASPLHCVPKKNGEWRFVGDYRALNKVTTPDRYPVPHIHDLLNAFQGKSVFTTIDLERAYHQIPIQEEDIPKTAVITPFGLFEFLTMQNGLCNASQTFQRYMHRIFGDLDFVVIFIDDICIASSNPTEHREHVEIVFKRLRENGLVINVAKCKFAQQQVEFLGYLIDKDGILPLPDRVHAVRQYELPTTVKQLRRFLALVNVYKRFIPQATDQQSELRALIPGNRKNDGRKVLWTERGKLAFEQCKTSLAEAALLCYPDPRKPLGLFIDASNTAAGAVLQQFDKEGWKPLGFYSEKFSSAQQKYSTFGRELTAMKMSVRYFRHLLEGRKFTIFTDHNPLTHAMTSNSPSRLPHEDRHLQYISQFTQDIRHISGKDNVVADTLSRVDTISIPSAICFEDIAADQIGDSELQRLLQSPSLKFEQRSVSSSGPALYCDTSVEGKFRPYVPPQHRQRVLEVMHGMSHSGVRATRRLVADRFIWTSMNRDVARFIKCCVDCQQSKIQRHTMSPICRFELPKSRFQHIHMDLVGPLPPSNGYRYLLTMVDRYTRWPEAVPIPDMKAETVARAFTATWVARFGIPQKVTTDQGRQFESDLFRELNHLLGSEHLRTTAYHPQANGLVERFHRTLKTALMCADSKHWADRLPMVLLGIRTALKEDLGCSVAELVYGQQLSIPGEFFDTPKQEIHRTEYAQELHRIFDDLKPKDPMHHAKANIFVQQELKDCQYVYVRIDMVKKPLQRPYEGPYKVLDRSEKFFDLLIKGKKQRVTIDRIKPAFVTQEEVSEQKTTVVTPSGHRIRFLV